MRSEVDVTDEKDKPVSALPAEDNVEEASGRRHGDFASRSADMKIPEDEPGRSDSLQTAHDILRILGAPGLAADAGEEAEKRRELNEMVHRMLSVGLAASTIVMLIGLFLSVILHRPLPSGLSSFRRIFEGLADGSPASFLDLGILLLIATPILRVMGSLVEFIKERDWQYATVVCLVLLIITVSVFVGSR
jgi:uncharacterized membrane protein